MPEHRTVLGKEYFGTFLNSERITLKVFSPEQQTMQYAIKKICPKINIFKTKKISLINLYLYENIDKVLAESVVIEAVPDKEYFSTFKDAKSISIELCKSIELADKKLGPANAVIRF